MKKQFSDPFIVQMDIADTQAGIVAAASSVPSTPIVPLGGGGWTITCDYRGHNTGSHSEVNIFLSYNGGTTGTDVLCMSFVMLNGLKLDYIKDTGNSHNVRVVDYNEGGFRLTGEFYHNSTETKDFNIQIVVKNGPIHPETKHKGAAGVSGVYQPCDVKCISYTAL